MRPVALIVRFGGPLLRTSLHGLFGHVLVSCRLIADPTVSVWAAGAVTVGAASTVHVNAALVALKPSASCTVTVAPV